MEIIVIGGAPSHMKTTEMPPVELPHLISSRRTEDMLVGPLADFYFNVMFAGHYVCKQSFSIRRSGMDSIFLLLTTAGEGRLTCRGKQYRLTQGTVMLIDTRIYHEYHAIDDGWSFLYLHFHGGMSRDFCAYTDAQLGSVFSIPPHMYHEVHAQLLSIITETEKTVNIDYAMVSSHIYTILTRFLSHENPEVSSEKSSTGLQRALAFITANYQQKISTDEIAAAAYLSRSYLSELFAKTFGMGPHEYLTVYRLSQVKKQLQNTDNSIADIAERTGFRDVFMLSRVFKNRFGMTPTAFRRQSRDQSISD